MLFASKGNIHSGMWQWGSDAALGWSNMEL